MGLESCGGGPAFGVISSCHESQVPNHFGVDVGSLDAVASDRPRELVAADERRDLLRRRLGRISLQLKEQRPAIARLDARELVESHTIVVGQFGGQPFVDLLFRSRSCE